jgi:hypothetical protein
MRQLLRLAFTVLSLPFLVVLYLNIETYAQSLGWDGLLSRWLPTMASFLLQPWIAIVTALFAGAAVGAWAHFAATKFDRRKAEGSLCDPKWAYNSKNISAMRAACAFAGAFPNDYASTPKAQAVFDEIRAAANVGWIPTSAFLETTLSRGQGGSMQWFQPGQPTYAGQEPVELDTIMDVKALYSHFKDRGWTDEWATSGEYLTQK